MGIMTEAPEGAEQDVSEDTGSEQDANESAQIETQPEPQRVPLPATKLSRREQARQERETFERSFNEFKASVEKDRDELRRSLAERDQQIARLTGHLEATQRLASQPLTQKVDELERLDRESRDALDRGDLTGYTAKRDEIAAIKAEKRLVEKYGLDQQRQPQAPAGMDPRLQMVIMSTPAASRVLSTPRGMELAAVKDRELAVMGYSDGPDRWKKALELADVILNGAQGDSGSSRGREALSGVPSGRGSAKSGKSEGQTVKPPSGWERWADGAGMSREEYLADYAKHHPEAIE